MKPHLGGTSPYAAKDQAKSDRATCFIGRGSPASSTHRYMLAWGALANKGSYTPEDIVFISAEGNRPNRIMADADEIGWACIGGAKIITDIPADRNRPYNLGEREVAFILIVNHYREVRPGQWIPSIPQP